MLKQEKKTKISISKLISKEIDLPIKNQSISFIYNLEDPMLQYFIDISSLEKIKDVSMCLFNVSQKQLKVIERMQELSLMPTIVSLIISERIKAMIPGTFNYLKSNINFKTTYVHTHSKFCTIKTEKNYYTIITSINSNPNQAIEQLTIINNEDVYNFHKNFLLKCQEEIEI